MKSVDGMVQNIEHARRDSDSKARDIHRRAEEMAKSGRDEMHQGIAEVQKGIRSKSREIHDGAHDMVAEGKKRMGAGIEAVKTEIESQVRENRAAAKEMGARIAKMHAHTKEYESHIKGHTKEVARYIDVFYHGEKKKS